MTKPNFLHQVHKKSRDVVNTQQFPDEWHDFLKTFVRVGDLFADNGPATDAAEGLGKFKERIATESKRLGVPVPELLMSIAKAGMPAMRWNARVSFLKTMLHFSRHANRDNQEVWIYSPPVGYSDWIYRQLNTTHSKVMTFLRMETETYTKEEKGLMVDALQMAMACAQKVCMKLASPDKEIIKKIKTWFLHNEAPESEINAVIQDLLNGFKKISHVCNSPSLIFSDDPKDRESISRYEKEYANVWEEGETPLQVMYIAGAFKKDANSGRLWMCIQTIIHEASHIALKTKDLRYDRHGLRPCLAFPKESALQNADNWGYFAIDVNGYLSSSDLAKVCS